MPPAQFPQVFKYGSQGNGSAAMAVVAGTLYMVWPTTEDYFLWTTLGSDLVWKPPAQQQLPYWLGAVTSDGLGAPGLFCLDNKLFAFMLCDGRAVHQQHSLLYVFNPFDNVGWKRLMAFPELPGAVKAIVHQGKIIVAYAKTETGQIYGYETTLIDLEDFNKWKGMNMGAAPKARGVISMHVARSGSLPASVRIVYHPWEIVKPIVELELHADTGVWQPASSSVICLPNVNSVASADATRAWMSVLVPGQGILHTWPPQATSWNIQTVVANTPEAWSLAYCHGDIVGVWGRGRGVLEWTMIRPGWYFDLTSWMGSIKNGDNLLLSELAIPGTSCSATGSDRHMFLDHHPAERRQDMDVVQQLSAGVRFLHFIIGISGNSSKPPQVPTAADLALYTPEGTEINCHLPALLKSVCSWLDSHPTEGIILFLAPVSLSQSPTEMAAAVNALIKPYQSYFLSPPATTPTMGQLRRQILVLHTLNPEGDAEVTISVGIDLGGAYPEPTTAAITSFTTPSQIEFEVQDYSLAEPNVSRDQALKTKVALFKDMIEKAAATGTISPDVPGGICPPQRRATWFLNWMNLTMQDSGPGGDALSLARLINPEAETWLRQRNTSGHKSLYWPRLGIVVSDFSDLVDGSLVSRIISMNAFHYKLGIDSAPVPSDL
ncbi:PLC-like phosphodiesterase [Nemania serpens]|nr:PLC-like phosphodiesterase [Nemania serpens]